ncbi:MAG: response regulator [Thermoanaerobaculia bacterium]|nr:response regulator [Thermoanaerobaculia bacterium]
MDERKRILVVEDNPDDRELMTLALEDSHLANEILFAEDGEQAVEIIRGEEEFAMILLDLRLPKLSGLEVLKVIRSEMKYVPVIILTTSDEQQDMIESYELGANSYIRKPVEFDEFYEATKQLGIYWLALNRGPVNVKRKKRDQ